MEKDLIVRQNSEIEPVRGKHHALPQTRGGWFITGITFVGTAIVCAVSHFDGGTVLGGLLVVGTVSGFSDDALHVLLYGRRMPSHLVSPDKTMRMSEATSELVHRLFGLERETDPRNGFKAKMARLLGLPEPNYGDNEDDEEQTKDEAPDVIPMGPVKHNDRMVNLADKLQLDIDDIAGKAIFICGIRRSGKTTLGVLIAEELGRFNIPMLIPDLKGDWLSCIKTLPNAIILGQGEATSKNAKAHGYAICEEDLQIILDVTSYDDMNEVARVIAHLIDGVFSWERKHPDSRKLCGIFLDEAQSYLPQDVKDSIISDPEARDALLNAYMRTIAIGGSLGLFPVILTQRIAQTNKKIIGQPELLFLFKQTLDNDLNRYKDFTTISAEKVRALKQGHGIFVDYEGQSTLHKFHKRTSSDAMSRTPRYRPVSPSPKTHKFEDDGLDFWGDGESEKEGENAVKTLDKRGEDGESFTKSGEHGENIGIPFTTEQEQAIILVALAIAQSGQKVTRSAIKDRLGWNNKQWDILKAVCDKHGIAS